MKSDSRWLFPLEKEKKKGYQRLKQATNSRYIFFFIKLLLLFTFERNMQRLEKNDKWLLPRSNRHGRKQPYAAKCDDLQVTVLRSYISVPFTRVYGRRIHWPGKYFISTNLLYDKIANRKIYSSTANDMYFYYIGLQHFIFNLLLNQFSLSKVIVYKFIHSGLLKFSIIILPEFAIFVVFLVTGWMVPIALYVAATKLVSVII
jgi:hypothetical protein